MKRIVILGAGYASIFAASNLCDNKKGFQITLVNDGTRHQLIQELHRVASGELSDHEIALNIEETFGSEIDFVYGKSESADLYNKHVRVRLAESNEIQIIPYDYLIIALGAMNEYFGIKGAKEYTFPLRSANDAVKLNEAIRRLPENSVVTIIGGGATGISLAGALAERYGSGGKKIVIRVIEAQLDILPGWDSTMVQLIRLAFGNSVEMITAKPIREINQEGIITLSSGETLSSNLTIWTAGIRGQDLLTVPEIQRTRSGRVLVDKYSRVLKGGSEGSGEVNEFYDNVFAIGDISAFLLGGVKGTISPQLAQFAVRQARNVAKNILNLEKGFQLIRLEYQQQGQMISLGSNCVGMLSGIPISGWLCETAEDFIIDNYIRAIRNRGEGAEGMVYDDPQSLAVGFATTVNFLTFLYKKIWWMPSP